MKKIFPAFLTVAFLLLLCARSSCLAADEDPCSDRGITVKNLALKEIWYQPQGGSCIVLKRHSTFTIKPSEEVGLFSDNVCKTPYCPAHLYTDYQSFDADGNCKVRILPFNALDDM